MGMDVKHRVSWNSRPVFLMCPMNASYGGPGKQKFEVLTLICPASDFKATLDTRFLSLACIDDHPSTEQLV